MACHKVRELRDSGVSRCQAMVQVASEYGCHHTTIYRWMKKMATTGELTRKKGGGRPPVTTVSQDLAMLNMARERPHLPWIEIVREVAPGVSVPTMRRRMKPWQMGRFVQRRKAWFTPIQLASRIAWCEAYRHLPYQWWQKVVCIDGFGADNTNTVRSWVTRPRGGGNAYKQRYTFKTRWWHEVSRVSAKFIAVAVPFYDWFKLYPIDGPFTTEIMLLVCHDIKDDLNALFPNNEDYMVIMDHDRRHIAIRQFTRDWPRWTNFPFPEKGQDLHIIENFFPWLKRDVRARSLRYGRATSEAQLRQRFRAAGRRLMESDYMWKCANSMPKRILEVLANDGHACRY